MNLESLVPYYEGLGLHCRIREPKYEWSDTKVTVSSDPAFSLTTHSTKNTGIEFSVSYDGEDVFINIIVVAKDKRGHGLARKLLVPIFQLEPETISLADESNGFWGKIQDEHPEITWKVELEESWSERDYETYLGPTFDPLNREWNMPRNPDDASSALWDYFKNDYLTAYTQLSEEERDEIATIISNAFWNGNSVGHAASNKG
jgi:hypothetical protein